jgi:membrane complex biogenesis BtpA family protein
VTQTKFERIFGDTKPVIAMVHLDPLPGAPLHDAAAGIDGIVDRARKDLAALQAAGVDAVMFGNENDRPYELKVDVASTAAMGFVIGRLRSEMKVPFGVNVLWDPKASVALAAATGAAFIREILTGNYASDMGPWTPNAGETMRYRNHVGRPDLALFNNISAEFAYSIDRRSLPERARSAIFSSLPDAILVSGNITGEAAPLSEVEAVKKACGKTPVLVNTGVRHATVADVFAVADGCIVGSSLKVDGDTWNPVDPDRAAEFMRLARLARK